MKKLLFVIPAIFLLLTIALAIEYKPLAQKFLLYQSIAYGETVRFNGNVFIVTGEINK